MEKRAQDLMNDCNCNHCATKKALLGVRLTQFSKADFGIIWNWSFSMTSVWLPERGELCSGYVWTGIWSE